jgi:hypothetical protein
MVFGGRQGRPDLQNRRFPAGPKIQWFGANRAQKPARRGPVPFLLPPQVVCGPSVVILTQASVSAGFHVSNISIFVFFDIDAAYDVDCHLALFAVVRIVRETAVSRPHRSGR